MSFLDVFAIVVLVCLATSALAFVLIVGALPGWTAQKRQHPHAQAVALGGWLA
jgi:hypothetical protein